MIICYPSIQYQGLPIFWKVNENQNSSACQLKCAYNHWTPRTELNKYLSGIEGIIIDDSGNAIVEDRENFSKTHPESIRHDDPTKGKTTPRYHPKNSSPSSNVISQPQRKELFYTLFEYKQGDNIAYYQYQENLITRIEKLLSCQVLFNQQWHSLIKGFRSLIKNHLIIQNLEYAKKICKIFDKDDSERSISKEYLTRALQQLFDHKPAYIKSEYTQAIEKLQGKEDGISQVLRETALKSRYMEEKNRISLMLVLLKTLQQPTQVKGQSGLVKALSKSDEQFSNLLKSLEKHLFYHHAIAEQIENLEVTKTENLEEAIKNNAYELRSFVQSLYKLLEIPNKNSHPVLTYFFIQCKFTKESFPFHQNFQYIAVEENNGTYVPIKELIFNFREQNHDLLSQHHVEMAKFSAHILEYIKEQYKALPEDLKNGKDINTDELYLSNEIAEKMISNLNAIITEDSSSKKSKKSKKSKNGFFSTLPKKNPFVNQLSKAIWKELKTAIELNLAKHSPIREQPEAASSSSSMK